MSKKQIKIKFINGFDFETGVRDILTPLLDDYEFLDSDNPDYLVFGPYGTELPKGDCIRIGYYCECMIPNMQICDWAFGIPYEEEIKHPNYMRIQWHGFDPNILVKREIDVDKILAQKTKFCNFIYSNPTLLREKFFQELSKYKQVDAPGKSMNNMSSIDSDNQGDMWSRKRQFLSEYRFTIAFENYSYPGYNTEKILDPMTVNSLPIYWGNPEIGRHFNTRSFINAHDYIKTSNAPYIQYLGLACQRTAALPTKGMLDKFGTKIVRKLKAAGRNLKINLQFSKDFSCLIERVIAVDNDDELYAKYMLEPWFHQNTPPPNQRVIDRWRRIFG